MGTYDDYLVSQNQATDNNTNFNLRILKWAGLGTIQELANIPNTVSSLVNLPLNINDEFIKKDYNAIGAGFYSGVNVFPMAKFDFQNISSQTTNRGLLLLRYNLHEQDYYNTLSFNFDFKGEKGIYNQFHREELEFLEKAELITIEVNLNDTDIAQLDLRRPVRIFQNIYYINTIEGYNPVKEGLTTVTLIKKNN